jgi:hypothetical protein
MLFDDIRPYDDNEVHAAMQRIADYKYLPVLATYIYPDRTADEVRRMLLTFHSVEDFQFEVMSHVNDQVIRRSMTAFTYDGLQQISHDDQYLYISNHRDIMLDASLLQQVLFRNGYHTTEITFGSNLMSSQLVIDIGKCNKMFRVERGGNMKDFYKSSLHLSDYIRYAITQKHQSVWIAQRNGRTKDGRDSTDQGIVKMFGMSRPDDKIAALAELHIVPIAISYEWESCDILKALELYESRNVHYVKKPGEDLNSILTGILQPKGRVHMQLCPLITRSELEHFAPLTRSDFNRHVAECIDHRIRAAYRLWPNNYIAHDMLYGNNTYCDRYTQQESQEFVKHYSLLDTYEVDDPSLLHDIFLGIYANPVDAAAH